MTGFNHATTGALIAGVVGNPWLAIPLAFASHFVMDSIPHFAIDMPENVFERNRQKKFRLAVSSEVLLSIIALITLPLFMRPILAWWITLVAILSAMFPDLMIIYRGLVEELTKKNKPENPITKLHLKTMRHHAHLILGIAFELSWFAVALLLITILVRGG